MANLEAFEPRDTFPYLLGTYMVSNAVPDAYIVVDSPDCAFFKAEHIFGTHDLTSTLLAAHGRHRIINTRASIGNIIGDRREVIRDMVKEVGEQPGVGFVGVCAMPMAAVTGVEYSLVARQAAALIEQPPVMVELPSGSLHSDWIHGYADTMAVFAEALPFPDVATDPDKVGVVGYFMHRTEPDHQGNIGELRRLMEGLGLSVPSVWFSGESTRELSRIAEAGTIVSLPYGRAAAKAIAERTGAKLVEVDLPLGFDATEAMVRAVAEATGRQAEADALHAREMAEAARALEFVIPRTLLGARLVVISDPFCAAAFHRIAAEIGAEVLVTLINGKKSHLEDEFVPPTFEDGALYWEASRLRTMDVVAAALAEERPADLVITHGHIIDGWMHGHLPFYEFGYPSLYSHAVADIPWLGYRGTRAIIGDLANRIALWKCVGTEVRKPSARPKKMSMGAGLVQLTRGGAVVEVG